MPTGLQTSVFLHVGPNEAKHWKLFQNTLTYDSIDTNKDTAGEIIQTRTYLQRDYDNSQFLE